MKSEVGSVVCWLGGVILRRCGGGMYETMGRVCMVGEDARADELVKHLSDDVRDHTG